MTNMQPVLDCLLLFLMLSITTCASRIKWEAKQFEQAKLECIHGLRRADIITWMMGDRQIFYMRTNETVTNKPRYSVQQDVDRLYLLISNVSSTDAGNYTCNVYYVQGKDRDNIKVEGELVLTGMGSVITHSLTALFTGLLLQACVRDMQ